MIYECDGCSKPLPAGVTACPSCGEKFDEAVPADAEVPKKGFTAVASAPAPERSVEDVLSAANRRAGLAITQQAMAKAVSPQPVSPPPPAPALLASGGSSGLRIFGCLLLLGSLALAGYYFLVFDTSVAVPATEIFGNTIGGGRVNNMGLMAERQNGIMIGMGSAILGAILMYAGRRH